MASEMRRMAKMLVERRSEAFASRYARDESVRRVNEAIEGFTSKGMVYELAWREDAGATWLDVSFAPSRATSRSLNGASIAMTLLIAAAAWSLLAPGETQSARVLLVILTVLVILCFPLVVVAFGSRRESEEATLRKKIRRAIVEEEETR